MCTGGWFLPEDFVPAYLLLDEGALGLKAREAELMLESCYLCPRRCGVDRTAGEEGFCRTLDRPVISSWGPHFGEEPPLVGIRGSGTIFFTNCNLGCVFCQNWDISHGGEGEEISYDGLAGIMVELQRMGCHNVNLVTPTHQMPMILRALLIARRKGLHLPIVYNCGGYESLDALGVLNGVIDIYMPDFKYTDPQISGMLSDAPDYPEAARAALKEMHGQVGDLLVDERGVAQRGMIVRHLVLPDDMSGTEEAMYFISREISRDTYVNVMAQYYPCHRASEFPSLTRRITEREYEQAVGLAHRAGLHRLAR
jgi:putative pyruvate formate lyase activating enzyme